MKDEERLPTGKLITRNRDAAGQLMNEMHIHGMLDIAIQYEYENGVKTSEMYFVNRRMVSRKRYEKERADYPDMPAPDDGIEDLSGALLKGVQDERRAQAKAAKERMPDTEVAARIDAFCLTMLNTGRHADATEWIADKGHTLGEDSHAKSRRLIERLQQAGCRAVHACDIEKHEDGQENTGHLVVQLPDEPDARKKILREIGRLASKQGLAADFDDGQRYAYVKLD